MNPSDDITVELVKKARLGCQQSMRELAELVEGRVRAYLYRVTLDRDLAEELLQETMLQMVKSLKDINNPQSFWAWIYRVAMGKAQHYYRDRTRRGRVVQLDEVQLDNVCGRDSENDGLNNAMRGELARAVFKGIDSMKFRYRSVLVLRCFEQKQYDEIAEIMDCNRTTAQVWFFRAKQILKKNLVKQGFSKAMMLSGLCLFGRMTAPAKAAITSFTVASESTKIGTGSTIIAAVTSKIGMLITALILGLGTGGLISYTSDRQQGQAGGWGLPDIKSVRSFHFVEQAWNEAEQTNRNLARGRSLSKGAYEQWFYFPQGVDGPMFMMMQRWDPQMKSRLCSWMQNGKGNYYFHSGEQIVYINNYHLPLRDLKTRKLPTDSAEFINFIDDIEGKIEGVSYERNEETGLLTGALDNRFYNAEDFHSSISYNQLNETDFDSFRYPWPKEAKVVDYRDQMHKRGWTYFKVRGEIAGREIYGLGRIPFVYEKLAQYSPWVRLEIDGRYVITDTQKQCRMSDINGNVLAAYKPGTILKCMSRPWMGMHSVDLVRREAAGRRVRYETAELGGQWDKALVKLFYQDEQGQVTSAYRINMNYDLVEYIELSSLDSSGNTNKGYIAFNYIEDVNSVYEDFSEPLPVKIPRRAKKYDDIGIEWIFELASGSLLD
jgi:RNA polymerase sigma-70 factor (ECF subfamily)